MTDIATLLTSVRRPRILIRAARAGVVDYRRERDLNRVLRSPKPNMSRQVMAPLLAEEGRIEATRNAADGSYNVQRHVAVLTAILAEARNFQPIAEAA